MSVLTAPAESASVSADLRRVVVVSRKTPIALVALTALLALLYGLDGRSGYTHFRFSESGDRVHVPTLSVDGMATAWTSVVVLALLVVASVGFVVARRKVAAWVPVVFALAGIVGFLAWAGAGSTSRSSFIGVMLATPCAAIFPATTSSMPPELSAIRMGPSSSFSGKDSRPVPQP